MASKRSMAQAFRQALGHAQVSWAFLAMGVAAIAIQIGCQFDQSWLDKLIYDRAAIGSGQWWRLWTGHLVHFGWAHFIADAGLFLILGCLLERQHPVLSRVSLIVMPAFVSAAVYWAEPSMVRYGGLSAIKIGLLLYLAFHG